MKTSILSICVGVVVLFSIGSGYASDDKKGVISDHASASPSGSELVFSADFDGSARIWAAEVDGSNLRKISRTFGTSTTEMQPVWSPDGRQIAYVSSNAGVFNIWVMRADGSYPVQLTANDSDTNEPAWSPDGKKIAYVSEKGDTKDIWIMNADGSGQTVIVALPGEENHPSFSPAGDKIVFSETVASEAADGHTTVHATLMVANSDGSSAQALTTGNFQDWDPYWGSSGIVFSSNRTASDQWKIWMIQPNGAGLHRVGDSSGLDPTLLPDGRILYTDETMAPRALTSIGILNPATGAKQIAVDVQGLFTPIVIRPGKAVKKVNPASRGIIEVAILSTKTFDATKAVNQSTITFGRTGSEPSLRRCSKKHKGIDKDDLPGIRCTFWIRTAGFRSNDKIGILRFMGNDGTSYEGRDVIVVVNTDDEDDFKDED